MYMYRYMCTIVIIPCIYIYIHTCINMHMRVFTFITRMYVYTHHHPIPTGCKTRELQFAQHPLLYTESKYHHHLCIYIIYIYIYIYAYIHAFTFMKYYMYLNKQTSSSNRMRNKGAPVRAASSTVDRVTVLKRALHVLIRRQAHGDQVYVKRRECHLRHACRKRKKKVMCKWVWTEKRVKYKWVWTETTKDICETTIVSPAVTRSTCVFDACRKRKKKSCISEFEVKKESCISEFELGKRVMYKWVWTETTRVSPVARMSKKEKKESCIKVSLDWMSRERVMSHLWKKIMKRQ